jgi:hypothetical protein
MLGFRRWKPKVCLFGRSRKANGRNYRLPKGRIDHGLDCRAGQTRWEARRIGMDCSRRLRIEVALGNRTYDRLATWRARNGRKRQAGCEKNKKRIRASSKSLDETFPCREFVRALRATLYLFRILGPNKSEPGHTSLLKGSEVCS